MGITSGPSVLRFFSVIRSDFSTLGWRSSISSPWLGRPSFFPYRSLPSCDPSLLHLCLLPPGPQTSIPYLPSYTPPLLLSTPLPASPFPLWTAFHTYGLLLTPFPLISLNPFHPLLSRKSFWKSLFFPHYEVPLPVETLPNVPFHLKHSSITCLSAFRNWTPKTLKLGVKFSSFFSWSHILILGNHVPPQYCPFLRL